jgi:plastocyanin
MRVGLLLAGLAALAAACSAGTVPAAIAPPTPPAQAAATATPAPTPRTSRGVVTVDAAEQYFNPEQVTVSVGTTVIWNDVQGTHDMVAEDRSFASAVLFEGGSYAHTFTTPGSYPYFCNIHNQMKGTIVVT